MDIYLFKHLYFVHELIQYLSVYGVRLFTLARSLAYTSDMFLIDKLFS